MENDNRLMPKGRIVVLGWGSFIWKPEGDNSVGQKPLLIDIGSLEEFIKPNRRRGSMERNPDCQTGSYC